MALKFLRLLYFEIDQYLLKSNWLLPIPIMLFISYIAISRVLVESINRSAKVNIWDGLFSIFGNESILFFVVTPLFLYLVSDLLPRPAFIQSMLLRLGSRKLWWLSKILTLGVAVISYIFITVGLAVGISSFVLPWQSTWTLQHSVEFHIAPAVRVLSPAYAFMQLIILLALGWFCLGLLAIVVSQFIGRPIIGLIVGISANFGGLVALRADVPPPYSHFFIYEHLLLNYHSFGISASPYPPLLASILYWLVGIGVLCMLGLWLSARQDFLSQ